MQDWYARTYRYNVYNRDQWVARQAACIPAGQRVLDVGAGEAPYRSLFDHCEYLIHDFGQTPEMLSKYAKLDYQSDITAIPVADQSFDVILCTEVLEHVPEPICAVYELSRILKPGGRLLLTAPLGSLLHQEPYHFYGGFTPHWYNKFLSEAGFKIEGIEANQNFFSLFGQEAIRFSSYIDPRRIPQRGLTWLALFLLWLLSLPLLRGVFPLLGGTLDRLGLENLSTAGYHVVAIKMKH